MVCPTGIEPVTPNLEGWCSIRLSYGQMRYKNDYLKLDQKTGRRGEIRTPDILLPKQARYQATLHAEGQKYSVNRAFGQFLYVKMLLYFKYKFELQA